MILSYERLDHADATDILLHNIVHQVKLLKHTDKNRMRIAEDQDQTDHQDRSDAKKDQRHFRIDIKARAHGKDQHDRCTDSNTDHHLVSILNVRDICRQSRDNA